MAETAEGGAYKVGDEWQDASGAKIDAPKQEKHKGAEDDELVKAENGAGSEAFTAEQAARRPGRPRGS